MLYNARHDDLPFTSSIFVEWKVDCTPGIGPNELETIRSALKEIISTVLDSL